MEGLEQEQGAGAGEAGGAGGGDITSAITAAVAYGLVCWAFYCINLISKSLSSTLIRLYLQMVNSKISYLLPQTAKPGGKVSLLKAWQKAKI